MQITLQSAKTSRNSIGLMANSANTNNDVAEVFANYFSSLTKAHLQAYILTLLLQLINICGLYDDKTARRF